MTKRRSMYIIILLSILLVVGLVASFVSFTYPLSINGKTYRYSCFVDELVLGSDINSGVSITYKAKLPEDEAESNYENCRNSTINSLKEILEDSGYRDSDVIALGNDQIYVRVGNVDTYEERSAVLNLIDNPKKVRLTGSSNGETAESDIASKYFKNVEVKTQEYGAQVAYYVDIQLNSVGTTKLKALTEEISGNNGKLSMYLGETPIAQMDSASIGIISDGHLTLYSEENFKDKSSTQDYVNYIKTGLLDLDLTQIYSGQISAGLGYNAILWLTISLGVLVLGSFVYLLIKYRQLGLMTIFNLLFFVVLGLFFLQAIPFVHINLSGLIAIAIGYILALSSNVLVCETAREEFANGKKLHTSFKLALKNTISRILVPTLLLFGVGVVCALVPTMQVQSFGMVTFILSLTSLFTSLVMFRVMIKLYSALNFYRGEKCNFKLEEGDKNV